RRSRMSGSAMILVIPRWSVLMTSFGVPAGTRTLRSPWRPGSQDPEDAIENATVIHSWHATRHIRQHRLDGRPLIVREFVAHDSASAVRVMNHGSAVRLKHIFSKGRSVAMRPKADLLCSS